MCWSSTFSTREGRHAADGQATVIEIDNPKNTEFHITDHKLYVPVVTLKSVDENKLLNQLKTGF